MPWYEHNNKRQADPQTQILRPFKPLRPYDPQTPRPSEPQTFQKVVDDPQTLLQVLQRLPAVRLLWEMEAEEKSFRFPCNKERWSGVFEAMPRMSEA
jgi:hypothetical protein